MNSKLCLLGHMRSVRAFMIELYSKLPMLVICTIYQFNSFCLACVASARP